jgi:DNA-binding CsgD family transcriptional regulator
MVPQPVAKYQRRLTPHRRELLLRVFAGETPAQIAIDLGRSRSTIAKQISRARARARLSAPRDVDALVECLASGIVTLDEILDRRRSRSTEKQGNRKWTVLRLIVVAVTTTTQPTNQREFCMIAALLAALIAAFAPTPVVSPSDTHSGGPTGSPVPHVQPGGLNIDGPSSGGPTG